MRSMDLTFDKADRWLCHVGLLRPASWDDVIRGDVTKLYAGSLNRSLPQFSTHLGITPFERSSRNIRHDMRSPLPIPDQSIDIFQSEDVFEHIAYDALSPIMHEIFRVLRPGGLFRLSVPDYRCPILLERSIKDDSGAPVFDPDGGGAFVNGRVVDGGHLWFPVYETVKVLFDESPFAEGGTVTFLHYTEPDGASVLRDIDYARGSVQRTPDHDDRVQSPRRAMSIVVDAVRH